MYPALSMIGSSKHRGHPLYLPPFLGVEGRGSGTPTFVDQKWPKSISPLVNFIVAHYEIRVRGEGVQKGVAPRLLLRSPAAPIPPPPPGRCGSRARRGARRVQGKLANKPWAPGSARMHPIPLLCPDTQRQVLLVALHSQRYGGGGGTATTHGGTTAGTRRRGHPKPTICHSKSAQVCPDTPSPSDGVDRRGGGGISCGGNYESTNSGATNSVPLLKNERTNYVWVPIIAHEKQWALAVITRTNP